jgi:DNA-binding IclR family transcriptional regulator
MTQSDENTIASVGRALDVLEELQNLERAGVTELADRVDMPASTVYNYLQTFEQRKYVKKDGEEYLLANRFIHIGDFAKHRLPIYRVGKSNVVWLADATEKTANLVVEEYGRGIYLMSENRERSLRNYSHVRRREYLHSTAAGKAILMAMSDDEIDAVVESEGLVERTDETVTDREQLFEDIDRARERGYAINDEENTNGIRAVGAPVENPDGSYAAVSVSGLVSRHTLEDVHEDIAPLVQDAAKAIQVELQP